MNISEKLTKIAENTPKVYEAGKKATYDDYWNRRQDYGNRTNYDYAFYREQKMSDDYAWFYPIHDICPTRASYFMRDAFELKADGNNNNTKLDLAERLEQCDIKMDFSKCTDVTYLFYQAKVSHLPVLNFTSAGASTMHLLFGGYVETVDKIIVNETNLLTTTFEYATTLKNIVVEGDIAIEAGTNYAIKLTDCKQLTLASAISFITHLKDYSKTDKDGVYSIKFASETWALLNADGNNSPNGNTWEEYIFDLGWTT